MSCQIKGIANFVDPRDVKDRLLGGGDVKLDHVPVGELPLQDTVISLSSMGDILAMAINTNMVILASKWDSQEPGEVKNKFYPIWSGNVGSNENEWITSVACLPLISLAKASAVSTPAWTCIAVGLNTGYLKFYTETGALLLEEQLENEPILGIKCQSHSPPRHAGHTGTSEELHILYKSAVCVLPGFALFSTLRAYRNHLARVQANCSDTKPVSNLAYKKWGFKDQDIVNDCQVIGTSAVNTFDHLMTASICGGYNASYRSSPPQHNLVMAVGKRPFVGFHYALEGGAAPVLTDVALAMASTLASAIGKIGTAVPWFRGPSKQSSLAEKSKVPEKETAESMTCRFGLSDIMREGDCLMISPNKALSVVNDAMGRVILLDNKRGIALRMWKGYRDAQCGWIEVVEDRHRTTAGTKAQSKSTLRTALFLVIYAPKKGVIDIWSIQQGTKITTFSASKNGRLLYINYGLLGLNDVALSSGNRAQYSCVFLDPIGGLKEILVPFHYALSSKNGKRARDIHLLKKLKSFMREEDFDDDRLVEEVTKVCTEIKTNEIRLQILEMLMGSKHVTPEALQVAATCFLGILSKYDGDAESDLEPSAKTLRQMATQLARSIDFYKYIKSQFDRPPEYSTVASEIIPDAKHLAELLNTSEIEIQRVLKLSKTLYDFECAKPKTSRVTFKEDGSMFLEFLSCFDFGIQSSIGLHKYVTDERKYQIASLIYQGWMYSSEKPGQWKLAAKESNIRPLSLMQFALTYWLNKRPGAPLEIELKRFTQLLHAICELANAEIVSEYNETSSWWNEARSTLSESTKPFQALTAALACRAISMILQSNKDSVLRRTTDDNGNKQQDEDPRDNANCKEKLAKELESNVTPEEEIQSSSSEWENVSKDTCQFTELIGNLEDATILSAVISEPPPKDDTTKFFALPFEKVDISLSTILNKGKGSVSEAVAKWLSSSGVDPARLIDTRDIEFDQMCLSVDSFKAAETEAAAVDIPKEEHNKLLAMTVEIGSEASPDTGALTHILERISLLKLHFPYSLTSSVLLSNLCWEFVMAWNRDVGNLEALEAALGVLCQIPMKTMRQGVCCLLWSLHIKRRMEAAAKLMNKLGKLPKERLCMQDTGLSDIQLTTMLQHCVTFLEIFLSAEVIESEKNTLVKFEELWEGHESGPQAFATVAISQPPAWYDLVLLHLQLANVLHMMAHFGMRLSKPMQNLFDSMSSRYFFQDITDQAILTRYRDDKRDTTRLHFLCRVITASMESIHRETNEDNTLNSSQAVNWMSKCQNLASIWMINNDKLRVHQVCQLYINGFDCVAEEVVSAVSDTEALGVSLLAIAGRRMMAYLTKTPDVLEEVSRISPGLTQYLESLNSTGTVLASSSNDDTVQLIRRVSRYLPETHSNYHYAQQMLEATFIYEGKT